MFHLEHLGTARPQATIARRERVPTNKTNIQHNDRLVRSIAIGR
jgi:hypothetical protein